MPSLEAVRALIDARNACLREASEKRDVDALMSWHAKDAVFTDVDTKFETFDLGHYEKPTKT